MDSLSIDTLAGKIAAGFLKPAALIPAKQWRERYKHINRAAGVVAGYAMAADPQNPTAAAQVVTDRALLVFAVGEWADRKTIGTLSYGLAKRVAKCLLALEGTVVS